MFFEPMDDSANSDATTASANVSYLRRVAVYIDGFNFYHALDELGDRHLKWLSWRSLANLIAKPHGGIVERIVFCTAKPAHRPEDVRDRHQTYVDALRSEGVIIKEGWFLGENMECRDPRCRTNPGTWQRFTEKEGDVSLALSLIEDAYEDRFDTAYLVTSDNDQVPTLKLLRDRFGDTSAKPKKIYVVFPNWRATGFSQSLANLASVLRIDPKMLALCQLPPMIVWKNTPRSIRRIYRPAEYAPPVSTNATQPV